MPVAAERGRRGVPSLAEPEPVAEPAADGRGPRTAPIPIAEELELDVAELGLADRLGLGEVDPDDEVGPTS